MAEGNSAFIVVSLHEWNRSWPLPLTSILHGLSFSHPAISRV